MNTSLLYADSSASISAAESTELAARLSALARSGLALEGGLRALAEEIGSRRLAEALRRLAAQLEKGVPLEKAIDMPGCRLPAVLRGLIVGGVQSGRLPEILDQYAALGRRRRDLRQRLFVMFAYPAALMSIVAVLLLLFNQFIVPQFAAMYTGFDTRLPAITEFYLDYASVIGWTVFGLAIGMIVVPLAAQLPLGSWFDRLTSSIPIIGPVTRHERYVRFSRLMATLLDAHVPLPDALNLAAVAMRGTMLNGACSAASVAVRTGTSLDLALADAGFLPSLVCLVDWGQKKNALIEAFRAAVGAFEKRSDSHTALLKMIVLPSIFIAIILFIGVSVLALFMPLISLISSLSGGHS